MATKRYGVNEGKRNYAMIFGVVIVVIVVLAAASFIIFFAPSERGGDEQKIKDSIQELYQILTGQDVEILATEFENNIYKIVIQTFDIQGNRNTQVLFVTKDGKMMTDRMIDLEAYKTGLQREKNFVQCLFDKGVRIVGLANNTGSVLQVQALGTFGSLLYFDCGGANLQICQDIGVQTVPSVIYNNTIYEGLKEPQWFIDTTGCTI